MCRQTLGSLALALLLAGCESSGGRNTSDASVDGADPGSGGTVGSGGQGGAGGLDAAVDTATGSGGQGGAGGLDAAVDTATGSGGQGGAGGLDAAVDTATGSGGQGGAGGWDAAVDFPAADVPADAAHPVVTSLSIPGNVASNDGSGMLRLTSALAEGEPIGSTLRVVVQVAASGAGAGARIEILSDFPSAGAVVGSGTLDGSQQASVVAMLPQGAATLQARVFEGATAFLDPEPALRVAVDFTPGEVIVAPAVANPYTGRLFPVEAAGAAGEADDILRTDVVVSVADNLPVAGGQVTLGRYDSSNTTLHATSPVVLAAGQQSVTFVGFPLLAGSNRLRATLTDVAGNSRSSAERIYDADLYGPTLNLLLRDAAGATLPCDAATLPSACDADLLAPSAGLLRLDRNATTAYCPSLRGACPGYQGGTRLFYSLMGCASVPGETCSTTVRLESRLAGSTGEPFVPVANGAVAVSTDQVVAVEHPGDVELPPGQARELRLVAVDQHGNVGTSNTVFLKLDSDGLVVGLERIRNGAAVGTGDFIQDGRRFGRAENDDALDTGFHLDLRVHMLVVGSFVPTEVTLSVDGGVPRTATLSGGIADFEDVVLPWCNGSPDEKPFTLTVTVQCGGTTCGSRIYSGLMADKKAPTYELDRCSLCRLGVPLVDPSVYGADCASCAGATSYSEAEKIAPSPAAATWNIAGDQDGDPANGFTIGAGPSPQPLVAILRNVEAGTRVTLISSQGALGGATTTAADCSAGTCLARWNGLHVPSLPNGAEHVLSLAFFDAAGNAGEPDPARAPEQIHARVDTIAPGTVEETICIGESTTPSTVADPTTDLRTYESPICAAHCAATGACSRRKSRATVVWQAPGDDGNAGGRVASYEIVYAAIGIRYPKLDATLGAAITDCSQMSVANGVEGVLPLAAAAEPLGLERAGIDGLYPHRAYCFRVQGVDDVGNRATAGSLREERVLPLLTFPGVASFVEWDLGDPGTIKDDYEPAAGPATAFHASESENFVAKLVGIGDIDGDGRPDFAVRRAAMPAATLERSVAVFMSGRDEAALRTPAVVIESPAIDATSLVSFAGGDFDGDGYSDLAICGGAIDTTMSGTPGGAGGGALYLYYGGPTGIRNDDNPAVGGDPLLPGKQPDVALFGPASARFCARLLVADVDGQPGAELIAVAGPGGMVAGVANPKVYGFLGGSRARFGGSPSATTKLWLDLATGAAANTGSRPDLAIRRREAPLPGAFPGAIEVADVNGDGVRDLLVADPTASHDSSGTCDGCGEVYVYRGGPSLVGEVAGADSAPAQLVQTVRFAHDTNGDGIKDSSQLGNTLLGVPQPAGPGSPDWVVMRVRTSAVRWRALVFQGKPDVGLVPSGSTTHTGVYPAGGSPLAEYVELDANPWNSTTLSAEYGTVMADIGDFDGHGGRDIMLGSPGARMVFLYSFNPASLRFDKRVILNGNGLLGESVLGIGSYLGASTAPAILVGMALGEGSRLFVFR